MNLLAVIPTWGIVLIVVAAVVALAIIGLVVGLIVREKRSAHAAEEEAVPTPAEEPSADALPQSQADARHEEAEEPPVSNEPADKPATQKPAKQKKPAQASPPAQGAATEEPAYEEPVVPKPTTAKTSTMRKQEPTPPQDGPEAAKEESSTTQENLPDAGEQVKTEKAKPATKTYHVSKRKSENKWQVKMAGGSKAIKMFITQAEAIDFAKKLAENQEAKVVIHKEDGSFRRLTYHKKK